MSAPSAFCRAQWTTRRPAAAVCRSASEDLPAQKDSSANLSSRRVPMRGKPRVAVLTVIFFITLLGRSEEHTSELQSLMRISYAVFCLQKKKKQKHIIKL